MPFGPLRGARAGRRLPTWTWIPAGLAYVFLLGATVRSPMPGPAVAWSLHAVAAATAAVVLSVLWLRRRRQPRSATDRGAGPLPAWWMLALALSAAYGAGDAVIRATGWERPMWFIHLRAVILAAYAWTLVQELAAIRAMLRERRGAPSRPR